MREIEVKAKIENYAEIIKELEKLGCLFAKPITQKDKLFLEKGIGFSDIGKNTNVLRIREQNDRSFFTLKRRHSNELDKIEKEVEIANPEEMEEILEQLGYHKVVEVNKVRVKCAHKDLGVCLDQVEGLGNFIEVEKMSDEDGEKVQEELFLFLESLGVSRADRVLSGYDTLIYNK